MFAQHPAQNTGVVYTQLIHRYIKAKAMIEVCSLSRCAALEMESEEDFMLCSRHMCSGDTIGETTSMRLDAKVVVRKWLNNIVHRKCYEEAAASCAIYRDLIIGSHSRGGGCYFCKHRRGGGLMKGKGCLFNALCLKASGSFDHPTASTHTPCPPNQASNLSGKLTIGFSHF